MYMFIFIESTEISENSKNNIDVLLVSQVYSILFIQVFSGIIMLVKNIFGKIQEWKVKKTVQPMTEVIVISEVVSGDLSPWKIINKD